MGEMEKADKVLEVKEEKEWEMVLEEEEEMENKKEVVN